MRTLIAICFLLFLPASFAADDNQPNLKSLYENHRWFELRDSVAKGGAAAFYQGTVACVFNDLHKCEKWLRAAIKSSPQSAEEVESHRTLASAYLRQGRYRKALAQVDALLGLRPRDSDALEGIALFSPSSANFPIKSWQAEVPLRWNFKTQDCRSRLTVCRRPIGLTQERTYPS